MDFINEQVHQIPAAEDQELIPVEAGYLKVLRIQWLIGIVILAMAAAAIIYFSPFFKKTANGIGVIAFWLLIAVCWYFLMHKSFYKKAYAIRSHDITYRSGWLIENLRTTPFSRVQHSNVVSGPIDRKFGLASLIIYTAGTGGADIKIPGLTAEKANDIKEWINKRVADASGTGE